MNAIIETKLTIISWKKNLTMISFDHIKFQLKINWQEIKTDPKHIDRSCIRVYLLQDFNIYFAWILDSDSNHEMENNDKHIWKRKIHQPTKFNLEYSSSKLLQGKKNEA